jgi:hypothetical protein
MGVLKRKQTLLGKEGIGPAFARGQRVRDRWESFLEVTLVSRIELPSVRAIGLGDRPETVPLKSSNNQPSRSNGSRTSRATIGVIICLSGV